MNNEHAALKNYPIGPNPSKVSHMYSSKSLSKPLDKKSLSFHTCWVFRMWSEWYQSYLRIIFMFKLELHHLDMSELILVPEAMGTWGSALGQSSPVWLCLLGFDCWVSSAICMSNCTTWCWYTFSLSAPQFFPNSQRSGLWGFWIQR